jgi:pyruvate formate lyase activating enzyme
MILAGLVKFSLINYPGKVCAVVFTRGCNFACPYCHNSRLIPLNGASVITEVQVIEFLKLRAGKLAGACVSGGEPTIQKELPEFIGKIKETGLSVKLDTNGSNPAMLEKLYGLNLLDFVAMDIKAPLLKYDMLAGRAVNTGLIRESAGLIRNSGLPYQFRTTMAAPFLCEDDIEIIKADFNITENYITQECVNKV